MPALSTLTARELKVLTSLSNPRKIQDFLDRLPMNHEKKGETHMSVRRSLREKKAHCIEGALIAAAALMANGKQPLLMDLRAKRPDEDHVVTLFKENGYWGAISKTNHAVLRYRDPVYKTPRELALSYFHEWHWGKRGEKTLRSYSEPLNLKKITLDWLASEKELWELDGILNTLPHHPLVPKKNLRLLRPVSRYEYKAADNEEWPMKNPRT